MFVPFLSSLRHGRADDHQFIALGTYCQTAAALRRAGLRHWAGPFDWLHSTPAMIADCIEDDFAALLDRGQMASVPLRDVAAGSRRQCRHRLFEPKYGLPPLFNHHDPSAEGTDFRRLARAVERLRQALHAPHDKTFVMMTLVERSRHDVERLADTLRTRARANALLVIRIGAAQRRAWRVTETEDGLGWAEFDATSASTGVRFEDDADDAHLSAVLRGLARDARGSRRPRQAVAAASTSPANIAMP